MTIDSNVFAIKLKSNNNFMLPIVTSSYTMFKVLYHSTVNLECPSPKQDPSR
jgi:hypothetical protein